METRINRLNPGASFSQAPNAQSADWLKQSINRLKAKSLQDARQMAERDRIERERVERERIAEAAENAKRQKGNKFQKALRNLKDPGRWDDEAKNVGGDAWRSTGGRAMTAFNALNELSVGAGPAAFGDLEIVYDEEGNPVQRYKYTKDSLLAGPKNFFSPAKYQKDTRMLREAGLIDEDDNALDIIRAKGRGFNNSELPGSVKFGVGLAVDPSTWVPVGATAKLTGLGLKGASKVAPGLKFLEESSKLAKAGRVATPFIEGFGSTKATLATIGGGMTAMEIADRLGLGSTGQALAAMGGTMLGGGLGNWADVRAAGKDPSILKAVGHEDADLSAYDNAAWEKWNAEQNAQPPPQKADAPLSYENLVRQGRSWEAGTPKIGGKAINWSDLAEAPAEQAAERIREIVKRTNAASLEEKAAVADAIATGPTRGGIAPVKPGPDKSTPTGWLKEGQLGIQGAEDGATISRVGEDGGHYVISKNPDDGKFYGERIVNVGGKDPWQIAEKFGPLNSIEEVQSVADARISQNVGGNVPRKGYGPDLPGRPAENPPLSSGVERFQINTPVSDRAGKNLGNVVGLDATTNTISVADKAGNVQVYPANGVYARADYDAALNQWNLNRRIKPVTPQQVQLDGWRARVEGYMRGAEALVDSPHHMARLFKTKATAKIGRAVDPGVKYMSPTKKKVHQAIVAGANLIHNGDNTAVAQADNTLAILKPLIGEARYMDILRGGTQVGALAAPSVAGIMMSELTGQGEWAQAGQILGVVGAGTVSNRQSEHGMQHQTPWSDIKPRDPKILTGPIKDAKSEDRLIDILQFWDSPEGYKIEALPPQRRAELQKMKEAWDARDNQMLSEVNAALSSAGMEMIPALERHAVLARYSEASLDKYGLLDNPVSPVDVRTTTFRREQSIEKRRELGETLREAYAKRPKLERAGSFRDLMIEQIKEQERIKASALVTGEMYNAELAVKFPSNFERQKMTPEQRDAADARHKSLTDQGWRAMPGVDDSLFHPDVIQTTKDLLATTQGDGSAVLNTLDNATNMARTALFVGDLSGWTLQGAMTAVQNPLQTIRNAPHLVGASVFGEAYANRFKLKNKELFEQAAQAGVRSYEHAGMERQLRGLMGLQIARLPGVRNVEERMVAFLDVQRALMGANIGQQEAFLKSLSPEGKSIIGKVVQGDVGHIALEAARYAPVIAANAAVISGNEIDTPGPDWMDTLFTEALGIAGSVAVDSGISRAGQRSMNTRRVNNRPSDLEVKSNVLGGKMTNRISGTMNRQVQGISAAQAQIERTMVMRSPALTRNTLALAKLAASDLGAEGALARMYLIKTAAIYGTGMAFLHAAKLGRMPEYEDFNPDNPDSPFSPESLGRARMGHEGSVTPSNPLVALARAFMYNDHPAGETDAHIPGASELGVGLTQWASGRLPDISGIATGPLVDSLATTMPNPEGVERPGLINRLEDGQGAQVALDSAKRVLPVSAQAAIDTGLAGDTPLGEHVPALQGDPNYNNLKEKMLGFGASFAGLNHSPESLGKEIVISKDEVTADLFPRHEGGYNTLNKQQKAKVRETLARDEGYVQAEEERKKLPGAIEDGEATSPIDQYFEGQDSVRTEMERKLELADRQYQATGDGVAFRERLREIADERRVRYDQLQKDLGDASAQLRGRTETVDQWLNRNIAREDKAVEGYYRLFDKATDPASGDLDFELLEKLQDTYLDKLPADVKDYVNSEINKEKKLTKGQKEYEKVKEITRPFFEARDQRFEDLKGYDPYLAQFDNYGQFRKYVHDAAVREGITDSDVVEVLALRSPGVKILDKLLDLDSEVRRKANPELDAALVKWYGYAPQSIEGKTSRILGQANYAVDEFAGQNPRPRSAVGTPSSKFKSFRNREK